MDKARQRLEVARYELERMNASFARQRDDAHAWATERAEREAWDATLIDGLARP